MKKISKIDKPSAKLTKEKRDRVQIKSEREIAADTTEIRRSVRDYGEQFCP